MPEGGESQHPPQPLREEDTNAQSKETGLTEQQERLKGLLFQSFRFSQGTQGLQEDILKWLVAKGCFDDVDIPEKPPAYIQNIVVPKKHPSLLNDTEKFDAVNDVWGILYHIKNLNPPDSIEELTPSILTEMIERDGAFQEHKRQNRPTSEAVVPDSSNDPHASFVRRFILSAQPTGSEPFDTLHKELAPLLTQYRKVLPRISPTDPDDLKSPQGKLFLLVQSWEKNHPGQRFFSAKNQAGESKG
jgi:hypothetical protein